MNTETDYKAFYFGEEDRVDLIDPKNAGRLSEGYIGVIDDRPTSFIDKTLIRHKKLYQGSYSKRQDNNVSATGLTSSLTNSSMLVDYNLDIDSSGKNPYIPFSRVFEPYKKDTKKEQTMSKVKQKNVQIRQDAIVDWILTIYLFTRYISRVILNKKKNDTATESEKKLEMDCIQVFQSSVHGVLMCTHGRNPFERAMLCQLKYFHLCQCIDFTNSSTGAIVKSYFNLDDRNGLSIGREFMSTDEGKKLIFPGNTEILYFMYKIIKQNRSLKHEDIAEEIIRTNALSNSEWKTKEDFRKGYKEIFSVSSYLTQMKKNTIMSSFINPLTIADITEKFFSCKPACTFSRAVYMEINPIPETERRVFAKIKNATGNDKGDELYGLKNFVTTKLNPINTYYMLLSPETVKTSNSFSNFFVQQWLSFRHQAQINKLLAIQKTYESAKLLEEEVLANSNFITDNKLEIIFVYLSFILRPCLEDKHVQLTDLFTMFKTTQVGTEKKEQKVFFSNERIDFFFSEPGKLNSIVFNFIKILRDLSSCFYKKPPAGTQNKNQTGKLPCLKDVNKTEIIIESVHFNSVSASLISSHLQEQAILLNDALEYNISKDDINKLKRLGVNGAMLFLLLFREKFYRSIEKNKSSFEKMFFIDYFDSLDQVAYTPNIVTATSFRFFHQVKSLLLNLLETQSVFHSHLQYTQSVLEENSELNILGYDAVLPFPRINGMKNYQKGWNNTLVSNLPLTLNECFICNGDNRIRVANTDHIKRYLGDEGIEILGKMQHKEVMYACSNQPNHQYYDRICPSTKAHKLCIVTLLFSQYLIRPDVVEGTEVKENLEEYINFEVEKYFTKNETLDTEEYTCYLCLNSVNGICFACNTYIQTEEDTHSVDPDEMTDVKQDPYKKENDNLSIDKRYYEYIVDIDDEYEYPVCNPLDEDPDEFKNLIKDLKSTNSDKKRIELIDDYWTGLSNSTIIKQQKQKKAKNSNKNKKNKIPDPRISDSLASYINILFKGANTNEERKKRLVTFLSTKKHGKFVQDALEIHTEIKLSFGSIITAEIVNQFIMRFVYLKDEFSSAKSKIESKDDVNFIRTFLNEHMKNINKVIAVTKEEDFKEEEDEEQENSTEDQMEDDDDEDTEDDEREEQFMQQIENIDDFLQDEEDDDEDILKDREEQEREIRMAINEGAEENVKSTVLIENDGVDETAAREGMDYILNLIEKHVIVDELTKEEENNGIQRRRNDFANEYFRIVSYIYCRLKYQLQHNKEMAKSVSCSGINCTTLSSHLYEHRKQTNRPNDYTKFYPFVNSNKILHRCCSELYYLMDVHEMMYIYSGFVKKLKTQGKKEEYLYEEEYAGKQLSALAKAQGRDKGKDLEEDHPNEDDIDGEEDHDDSDYTDHSDTREDEEDELEYGMDDDTEDGDTEDGDTEDDADATEDEVQDSSSSEESDHGYKQPNKRQRKIQADSEMPFVNGKVNDAMMKTLFSSCMDKDKPYSLDFYCPSCRFGTNNRDMETCEGKKSERVIEYFNPVLLSLHDIHTDNEYDSKKQRDDLEKEELDMTQKWFTGNFELICTSFKKRDSGDISLLRSSIELILNKYKDEIDYSTPNFEKFDGSYMVRTNYRPFKIGLRFKHKDKQPQEKQKMKMNNMLCTVLTKTPYNQDEDRTIFENMITSILSPEILNYLNNFSNLQIEIPRIIICYFNDDQTKIKIWDSAIFTARHLNSINQKDVEEDEQSLFLWNASLYRGFQSNGDTSLEGYASGIHSTPFITSSISQMLQKGNEIWEDGYTLSLLTTNIDHMNSQEYYNSYFGNIFYHYIIIQRTPRGRTQFDSGKIAQKKKDMVDKTLTYRKSNKINKSTRESNVNIEYYDLIHDIFQSAAMMDYYSQNAIDSSSNKVINIYSLNRMICKIYLQQVKTRVVVPLELYVTEYKKQLQMDESEVEKEILQRKKDINSMQIPTKVTEELYEDRYIESITRFDHANTLWLDHFNDIIKSM